jgi:hypothetical protein
VLVRKAVQKRFFGRTKRKVDDTIYSIIIRKSFLGGRWVGAIRGFGVLVILDMLSVLT